MQTNKSNTETYLIRLTPLGSFFFGGENSFNTLKQERVYKGESKDKTLINYFSKSNRFPQQTALLGMLRHACLMYTGKLNATVDDKVKLIGKQSFNPKNEEGYGIIKNLYPVFLTKCSNPAKDEFEYWIEAGKNIQDYESGRDIELQLNTDQKLFTDLQQAGVKPAAILIGNYDQKKLLDNRLLNPSTKATISPEDIFYYCTKVGVDKQKGQTYDDEDAYYKQMFQRLKDDWQFAFYVEVEGELPLPNGALMPFGADQSEFKVNIKKESPELFNVTDIEDGILTAVTLLSDAYVNNKILAECDFGITDTQDFRYIMSDVSASKEEFYRFGSRVNKSTQKLNLLQKGSVLFTRKAKTVTDILKEEKGFRLIGYNYFKIKPL
jgi:CRISPR-associated protein Cmr3